MEGWIKIHKRFLDWEWFQEDGMVRLFLNLILRANFQPRKWKGIVIERGQLITGRKQLSIETGLSERTIRTCLQRLEDTGEILRKTTNKFSIINICNYDTYQLDCFTNDQQTTNKRPTNDQQTTTNEEYKNIYNKENSTKVESKKDKLSLSHSQELLENRSKKFYDSLISFVELYGKEMIRSFYDYWTEPNKSKTKMRFEMEKTWDVKRRLNTWSSREKINHSNNGTANKQQQQQQRAREIEELNERLLQESSQ